MIQTGPMSEVGRELKVSELKPQTVVVIKPPDKDVFVTMWIEDVDDKFVTFYAGERQWHVINFVRDGAIYDDRGRQVHVFEFLGKV